ncbi:outer membrane protein assembly factor BamE [Gilvimarinus sp. F26214L]|uniref:outer membrane protein assembly factor BamE n=1 Tax=Gilvimarinus sp. DZF01 TaxID=3461371 RepID=UPI0040459299
MRKSYLRKTLISILVIAGATSLGACSWFQFPGVYRLTIQQGNIVTQDMIDQLQPGMTKRQVNYVLGTPLITDSFQQNRWDYFFSVRDSEGETTTERLTVFFDDGGQLTHFVGDFRPSQLQTAGENPGGAEG